MKNVTNFSFFKSQEPRKEKSLEGENLLKAQKENSRHFPIAKNQTIYCIPRINRSEGDLSHDHESSVDKQVNLKSSSK